MYLSSSTPHSPTPGTDYSVLQVDGSLNLGDATLSGVFGPGILNGDTFTIITATGGVTGTFSNPTALFISGQKFQIIYNPNSVQIKKVPANATVALTTSANPTVVNRRAGHPHRYGHPGGGGRADPDDRHGHVHGDQPRDVGQTG